MEIMGAWEVQDLRVACHAELLLDSRSLMEKRNATSGKVPSLRPGGRNNPTLAHDLCICKTILVHHIAATRLVEINTQQEILFC